MRNELLAQGQDPLFEGLDEIDGQSPEQPPPQPEQAEDALFEGLPQVAPEPQRALVPWRLEGRPIASWQEQRARMFRNLPRSVWNNIIDTISIVQPIGTAAHGSQIGTLPGGSRLTLFPRVQDLGTLIAQLGLKGLDLVPGIDIETQLLDRVFEVYKRNYGFGPEGMKGMEQFIAEDPVGLLTDMLLIGSLGSSAVTLGAKAGTAAAKAGTAAAGKAGAMAASKRAVGTVLRPLAAEKWSPAMQRVNKVVNEGFTVPGSIRDGANVSQRPPLLTRALFGAERTEAGDVKLNVGLSELYDPGALALRAGLRGTAKGIRAAAGITRAGKAAEELDIEIPISAKWGSRRAAAAEAVAIKRDDPVMREQEEQLLEDLERVTEETVLKIHEADDFEDAGVAAIDGMDRVVEQFREDMDARYDSIQSLDALPISLEETLQFFLKHRRSAEAARPVTGRSYFGPLAEAIGDNMDRQIAAFPDTATNVNIKSREMFRPAGDVPGFVVERARRESGESTRMIQGNYGNNTYAGTYDVVDLEDLIPSHLETFAENPRFQEVQEAMGVGDLQPRLRSRDANTEREVLNMASGLNPNMLVIDNPNMGQGAPITANWHFEDADGNFEEVSTNLVLSGNARVMALRLAARQYPERMQAYKDKLTEDIERFGLSPDILEGKETPVLIRRLRGDVDLPAFAAEANPGRDLRASEVAAVSAKYMSDDLIAGKLDIGQPTPVSDAGAAVSTTGELIGDQARRSLRQVLESTGNREFLNDFLSRIPDTQQGRFFTSGRADALTDSGYEEIGNALLSATYSGEWGVLMARRFAERGDTGMRNIRSAIMNELPIIAKMEALIRVGERDSGLSVSEHVAQAVWKLLENPDTTAAEILGQRTMPFYDDLSEMAAALLPILERAKTSPVVLRRVLATYANRVMNAPSTRQGTFELDMPGLSKSSQVLWLRGEDLMLEVLGQELEGVPNIEEIRTSAEVEVAPQMDAARAEDETAAQERAMPVTLETVSPQRRWTWKNYKEARSQLGREIFTKDREGIVSRNLSLYIGLYDAMGRDLLNTVRRHSPEDAEKFMAVQSAYAQGIKLINGQMGRRILRASDKATEDQLVPSIYRGSRRSIEQAYQLVGGKNSDAGRQMQASMVRHMFEQMHAPTGEYRVGALRSILNRYRDKKLRVMFDDETVNALNNVADVMVGMREYARMTQGSQTAFLIDNIVHGTLLGRGLAQISRVLAFGDVIGGMLIIGEFAGKEAMTKFFTSNAAELYFQSGGFRGRFADWWENQKTRTVRNAMRAIAREEQQPNTPEQPTPKTGSPLNILGLEGYRRLLPKLWNE